MRHLPVLLLALAACTSLSNSGEAGGVRLTAHPATVSPGDSVHLTLENGGSEPVGYNLCTSALERRAGESWQAVPSDRVCTMELRTLQPGAEASFAFELPSLSAGEYRAVTGVERLTSGGRETVASAPFQVE